MAWIGVLLLGALFGKLVQLGGPWIVALASKGALTIREKRLAYIIQEYQRIKRFSDDRTKLVVRLLRTLMNVMMTGIVMVAIVGTIVLSGFYSEGEDPNQAYWRGYAVIFFGMATVSYMYSVYIGDLDQVRDFEVFRRKTIAQITKLGGKPQDLDRG